MGDDLLFTGSLYNPLCENSCCLTNKMSHYPAAKHWMVLAGAAVRLQGAACNWFTRLERKQQKHSRMEQELLSVLHQYDTWRRTRSPTEVPNRDLQERTNALQRSSSFPIETNLSLCKNIMDTTASLQRVVD